MAQVGDFFRPETSGASRAATLNDLLSSYHTVKMENSFLSSHCNVINRLKMTLINIPYSFLSAHNELQCKHLLHLPV